MVELRGFKQKLGNILFHRNIFFPGSPLDEKILEKYFQRLIQYAPQLLQAYPTPLTVFAESLLDKGYQLSIPAISCTAEPLLEYQREIIEAAFGVKAFNWYGAREAGRIATECERHNGMHINLIVYTLKPTIPAMEMQAWELCC